ncbi:MAG: ribosome maturation factor RimP [bacterium]|nr:ribosome maturation factor RimP [bacterium]MDD6225102.1 ribosome maturation factor RimP [bacterium]
MADKKGGSTVDAVWKLIEPIVNDLGLQLWDVRYVKEGAQWYLRVYIDKDGGVGIEDCERVSRSIDEPLDRLNPIEQSYCLEVCSPGLERELIRPEHYKRFLGADIMVKMIRPIEGIGKEFGGVLKDYDKGEIIIEDHDGENSVTVNKKDIVWVKLDDFDI